jgi:hypothetical protein
MGALVLGLGSGCGLTKNLDEMHDATQEMSTTTKKVASTSENLEELTEELYTDLRQGNAVTIRSERQKAMESTTSIESKVSEAGKYYMAFEFQLWKNFGPDSEEKLNFLLKCGFMEFFRDIARYMPADRAVTGLAQTEEMRNLYALAATMHEVNPNQEIQAKAKGAKTRSVLSLIKEALAIGAKIETGKADPKAQPEWVTEVLAHEQDAVYLLQLRAAFLPAMAFSKLTTVPASQALAGAWAGDVSRYNTIQIFTFAGWLKEAMATAAFLKEIGREYAFEVPIRVLFGNLNPLADQSPNAASKARAQAVGTLNAVIDGFKKANPPAVPVP